MTVKEFNQKLEQYKISNAPVKVKERKIRELKDSFYGVNSDKRKDAMVENCELTDIEGGY